MPIFLKKRKILVQDAATVFVSILLHAKNLIVIRVTRQRVWRSKYTKYGCFYSQRLFLGS